MTVMTLLSAVMLLGFGALVADIGRLYNLTSQMQVYVDQVALSAAAELDGQTDALTRATRAAVGDGANPAIVRDVQNFAGGNAELSIQALEFYTQLPADNSPDYETQIAGFATTDGTEARFVRVHAVPRQENFLLMPLVDFFGSFFGFSVTRTVTAEAQAIAGFKREVCNSPPLMICNPYEMEDGIPGGGFTPVYGQQILLKGKGNGSSWVPGDFGLLQAVEDAGEPHCSGGGANRIRCVLGLIDPNTRCVAGTVDTKPGESVSVHAGINVRFDIWDNNLSSYTSNNAFRPSANVTKGMMHQAGQCSSNKLDPSPDTTKLPRDGCFEGGSCWNGNPRFGLGNDWDRNGYWATNHPALLQPPGFATMTRYDIYRYEIEQNIIPDTSPVGENGNPSCSVPGIDNPERDRRMLNVAVINCVEHDIRGQRDDIPVIAFAEMFLTEYVGFDGPNTDDIYAEMLGVADPGDESGVLHDFPVLYR